MFLLLPRPRHAMAPKAPQQKDIMPPIPADGDTLILTPNVDLYEHPNGKAGFTNTSEACTYRIYNNDDHSLSFVLESDEEGAGEYQVLMMECIFDSTQARKVVRKSDLKTFHLFIHFPISRRDPLPSGSISDYFLTPLFECKLCKAQLWFYDAAMPTLAQWRAEQTVPKLEELAKHIDDLATQLDALHKEHFHLLRFCPNNVVITDKGLRFMGVTSLNLPWNEDSAKQNGGLPVSPYVPPECRGFMRLALTPTNDVYVLGAVLYALIANVAPPISELLEFDCPMGPRAFVPSFPIGLDEVIFRSIAANPTRRYADVHSFLRAFRLAIKDMQKREKSQQSLSYVAAADTHIGINKRQRCPINQDAVFIRESDNGQRILLLIGDGISTSTYGTGDLASALLVENAEKIWTKSIANNDKFDANQAIKDIFAGANQAICNYILTNYGDKNPNSSESMGTTAIVAIVNHGLLTIGSIGDSRAYLIDKRKMSCITRDHNLFTMALVNGIPVHLCAAHPHAGSLVQCLGFYEELGDKKQTIFYDTYQLRLMPGDRLVLTTDGVLDYAAPDIRDSEAIIGHIVSTVHDPALACLELILAANRGGGGDNIGVALLYVDDDETSTKPHALPKQSNG